MLRMFQRYFEAVRQARSDADIVQILGRVADDFGFHSGYLIEYRPDAPAIRRVLDTDARRAPLWVARDSARQTLPQAAGDALPAGLPVIRLTASRLGRLPPEAARFIEENDLIECTIVPITAGSDTIGMAGLAGNADLDGEEEAVLPLIAYSLFARMQAIETQNGAGLHAPLTNREKQVLALSARGRTSQEIARELGMSPRTVNQHVDNVADKLGTRNRAHTVAEVIRHHLLD